MGFIVEDRKDLDFLPEGYGLNTYTRYRNNKDVSLNSYGEQFIQLCIASKLRVTNGRTRGDLQGLIFGFRKHFPIKRDTVPFSANFYEVFRP